MGKNKVFGALLFIIGLVLSLITNLFTGDDDILSFYDQNKNLVLTLGIGLAIIGIIISAILEAPSQNKDSKDRMPFFRYFVAILLAGVEYFLIGLVVGLILFWGLNYILDNYFATSEFSKYFKSNGALRVLSVIGGVVAGGRFRYVYGNELTGVILGLSIGYAVSYYFSPDLQIDFLPIWLSNSAIISTAIVCGSIGLFTAVFHPSTKPLTAKDREYAQKASELAVKKRKLLEEKLDRYDNAVKHLRSIEYEVYTGSYLDKMYMNLEDSLVPELDMDIVSKKITSGEYKSLRDFINKEVRTSIKTFWLIRILESVKIAENEDGSQLAKPKPPFFIYNEKSEQVKRYASLDMVIKFSEELQGLQKVPLQKSQFIEEVKKKIADGKTSDALQSILEFTKGNKALHDSGIILSSQFANWEKEYLTGQTLDKVERNRIHAGLLKILDDLEKEYD